MTIEELTFEAFKQGREQGREESAAQIERLREEVQNLMDELAYHGVYPKTHAALQPKEG
jgi:hypothetical protein